MKTAGMVLMSSLSKPSPKFSSSRTLVKTAFFSRRNFSASATALASVGSSSVREITDKPLPAYFRCISTRCGKFSLQGPQVVAHTSTRVNFAGFLEARRSLNWLHFSDSSLMVPVAARSSAAAPEGKPASTSPAARKNGESTAKNNLMTLLLTGRGGEQSREFHATEHEQGEPPKPFGGSPIFTSRDRIKPDHWAEWTGPRRLLYF